MSRNVQPTPNGATLAEDVVKRLALEYGLPRRNPPIDPVSELVGTILSQHTSDSNTERAFRSLIQRFPSWPAVIDASTVDIADAIHAGGLANVKAARIQQALRMIVERSGSLDLAFLGDMSVADARTWLTTLPGVGPKTASCVLLFSLDRPAMPVDTHVQRVSLRLGLVPSGTNEARTQDLLEALLPAKTLYDAHKLMIHHGRATCVARRPACHRCVLQDVCPSVRIDVARSS
jgi:endonuclease III